MKRGSLRIWLAMCIAAAAIPVAIVVVVMAGGESTPDGRLRLVGIVHADEPVLLNTSGKLLREVCPSSWPSDMHVEGGRIHPMAVFEPREDLEGFVMGESTVLHGGATVGHGSRMDTKTDPAMPAGTFLTTLNARQKDTRYPHPIFRRFGIFGRIAWLEKGDIRARFYEGPMGEAEMVFAGPFGLDGASGDRGAKGGQVWFSRHFLSAYRVRGGTWGTKVRLEIPIPYRFRDTVMLLWYDTGELRRGALTYLGVERAREKEIHRYFLPEVEPAEIGAITVNEKPHEVIFRNVVLMPEGPPVEGPLAELSYNNKTFVATGLTLSSWDKVAPELALKAGHVARGSHLRHCLRALSEKRWLANLPGEDRAILETLVARWSEHPDPAVRIAAARIGIGFDLSKYLDTALAFIAEDVQAASVRTDCNSFGWDGNTRAGALADLCDVLHEKSPEMTGDEVRRLADAAASADLLFCAHHGLLGALSRHESPEATAAIEHFARDERPWYWLRVLMDKRASARISAQTITEGDLKARMLVASVFEAGMAERFSDALPAADAMLEGLLTDELNTSCPDGCARVIDSIARRLERERATEILVRFALSRRDFRHGRSNIRRAIAAINRINGSNIAGIHRIPERPDSPVFTGVINPRLAQLDLEHWLATGESIPDVPPGFRAGPGDLRVIAFPEGHEEDAIVSLWSPRLERHSAGLQRCFRAPWGHFAYMVRNPLGKRREYDCNYNLHASVGEGRASESLSETVMESTLPHVWKWRGSPRPRSTHGVTAVEAADSPESVLSGTKVFEEWWEKYGPVEAPGD